MKYIYSIFKQNIKLILLVYLICSIGNILFVIEPYILGKMIDGVLNNSYLPLLWFIFLQIGFIIFGLIRRIWDTKIFTKIQNRIILSFIEKNKNVDESIINARVEMTKEIVGFLENEIPHYIGSFYIIIGSLLFVFNINILIGILLISFLLPSVMVFKYYYLKDKRIVYLINSNHEKQIDKIKTHNLNIISNYLNRRRNLKVLESTVNAKNWAVFDILTNVFLVISILIYVILGDITPGMALAFYIYVNNYLGSILNISFLMSTYARIKDISFRLN